MDFSCYDGLYFIAKVIHLLISHAFVSHMQIIKSIIKFFEILSKVYEFEQIRCKLRLYGWVNLVNLLLTFPLKLKLFTECMCESASQPRYKLLCSVSLWLNLGHGLANLQEKAVNSLEAVQEADAALDLISAVLVVKVWCVFSWSFNQ